MGRDTRETWAKRVQRWLDSGLTAAEFAAEIGVNPRTLSYWKWRLGTRRKKPRGSEASRSAQTKHAARRSTPKEAAALSVPSLSFVEVPRDLGGTAVADVFEVELVSGERIRIPSSFDAAALSRLLEVLGRQR